MAATAEVDPYLRDLKKVNYDNIDLVAVQYAAGISDADGCFKSTGNKNPCLQFCIEQSIKGAAALVYLYDHFGGSIKLQIAGDEKNQRAYSWTLNGSDAKNFARIIHDYSLLKKREASLFLEFPDQNLHIVPILAKNESTGEILTFDTLKQCKAHLNANLAFEKRDQIKYRDWSIKKTIPAHELQAIRNKRADVVKDLVKFKTEVHEDIPIDYEPPVPYLAGFFDGDGTLDCQKKFTQHHSINQKSVAICELYKRLFGGTILKDKNGGYRWDIYNGADDFIKLIGPFIVGKKKQVELVLAMKPGEGEKTHALLRELKGKGKMKTPKIDRFKSGQIKDYTAAKALPKGVFHHNATDKQLVVQLQHDNKVYKLKRFNLDKAAEAEEYYKDIRRKIRLDKNYKITEYISFIERGTKRKAETL